MRRSLPCLVSLLLIATGLAHPSAAQHRSGRGDGGRVILYAEADFRGDAIVLYPGDRVEDFARQSFDNGAPANDRISSVVVEGAEIVLHADSRFRGDALRLTDSVSNLADVDGPGRRGTWNDVASSAAVTARDRGRRAWPRGTGRGTTRGARVELYSDSNYRGSRLVLVPGDRVENLANFGFEDGAAANDRISSLRLTGGAAVIVHQDADFRGERREVEASVPDLAGLDGTWNDRISSLLVISGSRGDAERSVERAYRELLGRAPEPAALTRYVEAMREQGWTDADLRREVRRSREYREREANAAVTRAYQEILNRAPDAGGLATYTRLMVEDNWSEARVREVLRHSDEFRHRHQPGS